MGKSTTIKRSARADLRLVPGLGLVDLAKPGLPESLVGKVSEELELFADRMHEGFMAAALAVGIEVFGQFVAAEVTAKAGPKGKHDPNRTAVRHGSDPAKIPMGGRMVSVTKPRIRTADRTGEIALDTWEALASTDLLDAHTVAAVLAGVSTRGYSTVLEPAGTTIEAKASSTSRSAVSRRFIAATKAGLEEFRSRPLDDRRFLVVYIDGFNFAEETMVGALGVDSAGNKVPLGVMNGTTENKTVCIKLLNDLESRGLDPSAGLLFVIDGGKAIYHAIVDKWSDVALIARCHEHKRRNVLDLMPKSDHPWVNRELNRAWKMTDGGEAERALRNLAAKIERTHPDAASSLREGLLETLTINTLGVTGSLARTLATTNPMESTIDIVKVHARNVKRWQHGDMRLRWAVAGMTAAQSQYRRVNGYKQLDRLAIAITAAIQRRQRLAEAS